MNFQDLIRLLSYTQPEDIHERQELVNEYCYANNIDLNKIYNK